MTPITAAQIDAALTEAAVAVNIVQEGVEAYQKTGDVTGAVASVAPEALAAVEAELPKETDAKIDGYVSEAKTAAEIVSHVAPIARIVPGASEAVTEAEAVASAIEKLPTANH